MTLILTAAGGVNWDNTRLIVVRNSQCADDRRDYGVGAENAARCPGCDRVLPTVCMHLDHILAQATHAATMLAGRQEVKLLSHLFPHDVSTAFNAEATGGTVNIYKLGDLHAATARQRALTGGAPAKRSRVATHQVIHTIEAWRNDLENLQFLCMSCNTSKQAREFAAAFPHRTPNPLVQPT